MLWRAANVRLCITELGFVDLIQNVFLRQTEDILVQDKCHQSASKSYVHVCMHHSDHRQMCTMIKQTVDPAYMSMHASSP